MPEPNPPTPFPGKEGGACRSPLSPWGRGLGVGSCLARAEWERRREAYLARVRPWTEDRLRRASRREEQPVYDFLFEYYSFRPAHLARWTPGCGVLLEGATAAELDWAEFVATEGGMVLPAAA